MLGSDPALKVVSAVCAGEEVCFGKGKIPYQSHGHILLRANWRERRGPPPVTEDPH